MTATGSDTRILRELAKRFRDAAESQDRRRVKDQWRRLHDRDMERPMIYIWVILFTEELEEVTRLECTHPLFREKEKYGCHYEINLKDVLTVQGDRERLREWGRIVRSVIE